MNGITCRTYGWLRTQLWRSKKYTWPHLWRHKNNRKQRTLWHSTQQNIPELKQKDAQNERYFFFGHTCIAITVVHFGEGTQYPPPPLSIGSFNCSDCRKNRTVGLAERQNGRLRVVYGFCGSEKNNHLTAIKPGCVKVNCYWIIITQNISGACCVW